MSDFDINATKFLESTLDAIASKKARTVRSRTRPVSEIHLVLYMAASLVSHYLS